MGWREGETKGVGRREEEGEERGGEWREGGRVW